MKQILFFCCMLISAGVFSQTVKENLLAELSVSACNCIDSISTYNKPRSEIDTEIKSCIDEHVSAYQLGVQLLGIDTKKKGKKKKEITIMVDTGRSSSEYKEYYYAMERHLMANCKQLKEKAASVDKQNKFSMSDNNEAVRFYNEGVVAAREEEYEKAVRSYSQALEIDSVFTFAWDNLALCYRKLKEFDKALYAYEKSLQIDPEGMMPLQNIPVVYQYMGEYQKAIAAYQKLDDKHPGNAEVYYGMGQVYTGGLKDYEKGLDNMCKAYNLYIKQNSPYRADAENIIQHIYREMKKENKEARFHEILKQNNITPKS